MKYAPSRPALAVVTLVILVAGGLAARNAAAGPNDGLPDVSTADHSGAPTDAKGVVSVEARFTAPSSGQSGRLFITAKIKSGWHIYSVTQPAGGPVPTKIKISPPPGIKIAGKFEPSVPPDSKQDPAFDNLTVETHHDAVTWSAPIELASGVAPAGLKIDGKVIVQPCDAKACLPPSPIAFAATFDNTTPNPAAAKYSPVAGTSTTLAATRGGQNGKAIAEYNRQLDSVDVSVLVGKLSFAFLGGLLLNLMPCVLPVISLKILAFVEQGGESRGRVFALNVWYSLGLLAVFMVLAAFAAGVGMAGGERLGWGQQFTLPWFKIAMTSLVFVMALSFLGVWEIPIPGFVGAGRANQLQAKEGPGGAFFKGVFTTILATPCSGPFLGSVFGWLLTQPPHMAYYIFGAVGLGMASPYLVIGAFPALIRFLPKPGAWMMTFQQLMGFLLLGTVVYLFNTLTVQYFVPTLALLVALWFACWWIGRTPLTASPQAKATAWLGSLAVALLIGRFAFTVLLAQPVISWQTFSPEALQQARAEGRTVIVDFTANWCPNCKANSKFAIETEAVRELIRKNNVVPLLADWTDHSPMIKKALNDLGYNSIPVLAIWPAEPSGQKPLVLPDLLSEGKVLDALKQAGPSKGR